MSFSLIIYEHPTPGEAQAVLATRDPWVVETVRRLLIERLSGKPARKVSPLKRIPKPAKLEVPDGEKD